MKSFRLSTLILIFSCFALLLAGCSQQNSATAENGTPVAAVILIGQHANSKCIDAQLETSIQDVYASFGNLGVIVVDGNPTLLHNDTQTGILGCYNTDFLENSKKIFIDNNDKWKLDYVNAPTNRLTKELKSCKADDPEVDMLQALYTAAESLNTLENTIGTAVKKKIFIVDTGLSTSGTMNFLDPAYRDLLCYNKKLSENNKMRKRVSSLLHDLESQAEIPDLSNVSITWYGMGQVSTPQPALSKLGLFNLQYIWGELFHLAGATASEKPNADKTYGIFVSADAHGTVESNQTVTPIQWNTNTPGLPTKKIYFDANSDQFIRSEHDIKMLLNPYVKPLSIYPDEKLLLVGTTSSYNDGSLSLSKKRAKHVKKILVSLGISENCIEIIGLGYNPKYCQDDTPDGDFIETIAKKNRLVLVLSYRCSKAQNILSEV